MSTKGKLVRLLGGAMLHRARVATAEDVGGFRLVGLRGDVPKPGAGTKLQILLPSDDMRTYTPIATAEGATLLGWKHAGGPGARWLSELQPGSEARFVGPQRSLELPAGPLVVVGDETSVAVAASFEVERPGRIVAVFQATDVNDARAAAQRVGLGLATVVERGDVAATVDAVAAARANEPGAVVALTGGSELVLAVRSALRARGIENVKTKTYWIPGKRGLD
jgi:NADPH-dependent ferric siderophore reductase